MKPLLVFIAVPDGRDDRRAGSSWAAATPPFAPSEHDESRVAELAAFAAYSTDWALPAPSGGPIPADITTWARGAAQRTVFH